MIITLCRVDEPAGVEFREGPYRNGSVGALAVAAADLERLAGYLNRRLDLNGHGSVDERLAAALREMSRRGEIKEVYARNRDHIATYCEHAGVAYEERSFDGAEWTSRSRWTPLFQTIEPNGFLRTVAIRIDASERDGAEPNDFAFRFIEDCTNPADSHPADVYSRYSFETKVMVRNFEALAAMLGERLDRADVPETTVDDRIIERFVALAQRGDLNADLPPGANRDAVMAWCREADVRCFRDGRSRTRELLRAPHPGRDTRIVTLEFPEYAPTVRFAEEHRIGDWHEHSNTYAVEAPIDALPALVEFFERRAGMDEPRGRLDDRLIACFDALVATGELNDDRPRAGNRARVAELFEDAGVATKQVGFERREQLLHVHRASTNCVYELSLSMNRVERMGIVFSESYDYVPRADDPGREYAYAVKAPYAQIETLVAHLERDLREPATGGWEDRLARCFHERVERGDLADGMPLRAARDRVAGWFAEAGVEAKPDDWHWFNSD